MSTSIEKPTTTITIDGLLEPTDKYILQAVMGRLGLSSSMTEGIAAALPDQPSLAASSIIPASAPVRVSRYRFSDLTSPEDILLREHIDDFAHRDSALLRPRIYTQAFHAIMDGNGRGNRIFVWNRAELRQARELQPMTGVQTVKRADRDLGHYHGSRPLTDKDSHFIADTYGAVVGSVLEALASNAPSLEDHRGTGILTIQALGEIAQHLTIQLNTTNSPDTMTGSNVPGSDA